MARQMITCESCGKRYDYLKSFTLPEEVEAGRFRKEAGAQDSHRLLPTVPCLLSKHMSHA